MRGPDTSPGLDRQFLIDEFNGSLVVIPEREARRLANLNDAIQQFRTWGDFLSRVKENAATREYLARQFEDELPPSDEWFDSSDLPGFNDGD